MRFILRVMGSVLMLGLLGMVLWAMPAGAAPFAYVANAGDNTVSGYTINATTGALTPIPGSPFAAAAGLDPLSVAVDPTGKFAYVVSQQLSNGVSGYAINATTGALTPIPGSPFATEPFPCCSVAVDPTGKFAYVANSGTHGDNTVSGYAINAITGALTPVPGSPFAAGLNPLFVAVDPTGKFAYVTNFSDNTVSGYAINATTGALTPIPGSPFTTGTSPVAVTTVATPGPVSFTCPLGQGFWKNNPSAWPVTALTLGSQTYTQDELLALFDTPPQGDASVILADQLIAAKLNLANGSDPTLISSTIADADRLLSEFTGTLPYHVRPSSATGQAMVDDATVLESYNNGELTPECTP